MGRVKTRSADKDALDGNIWDELIHFSDLKPRVNKYLLELWESEWDEHLRKKLYKIFSKLNDCIFCTWSNRREETVISRLHIGHS